MDAVKVKQMRQEMDKALAAITAKHGVDFHVGRITYDSTGFRCKVTATERGALGTNPAVPANKDQVSMLQKLWLLGNSASSTAQYQSPGLGKFNIVGYRSTAKKYPWIVQKVANGARFKLSTMSLKTYVAAGATV